MDTRPFKPQSVNATVADLPTHAAEFDGDTLTERVKQMFDKRTDLPGAFLDRYDDFVDVHRRLGETDEAPLKAVAS